MRINNNSSVGRIARNGKARKNNASQGSFQPGQARAATSGTQPSGMQSIRGVDALLAIQEVGSSTSGKKKRAVRRGHSMLDILDEIRTDLLAGGMSGQKLQKLLKLVSEHNFMTGDANLDGVLGDIELRARVELAKRGLGD